MSEEKQLSVPVLGMTCANCVASVERNARKVDGVSEAVVNFASEKLSLTYDPALANPQEVIDRVHRAGYEVPTSTIEFPLIGMTCANCASNIERALGRVDGVLEATVNYASEKATVRYIVGVTGRAELTAAVRKAGYDVVESEAGGGVPGDMVPPWLKKLEGLPAEETSAELDQEGQPESSELPEWLEVPPDLEELMAEPSATATEEGVAPAEIPSWLEALRPGEEDLEEQAEALKSGLAERCILWISYPKLSAKAQSDLSRDIIWSSLGARGLKAVAQISIDETWSAMRFKKVE